MSITAASPSESALVVFSGGQDSTTCLAWALERFERVETIGFTYGQAHAIEMECRLPIRDAIRKLNATWDQALGEDIVLEVPVLGQISDTALTADVEIAMGANGLPTTFVPGRNLVFLTFAAAVAYRRGIKHIITGVCETDYSGYPDCRDDTIKALQVALNLGMETRLVLHTPLMWIDKAATWALAEDLGGPSLIDIVRSKTHTCYRGNRTNWNEWGYGCGTCPACELRMLGWKRFIGG